MGWETGRCQDKPTRVLGGATEEAGPAFLSFVSKKQIKTNRGHFCSEHHKMSSIGNELLSLHPKSQLNSFRNNNMNE